MSNKVELQIVKAHELDPSKKYLIELDNSAWTLEDAHNLAEGLHEMDVEVIVGVRQSNHELKVVELPAGANTKA